MSCPYTSQQNGKAERLIRTVNNVTRTLLFQASMPPSYWADALATATYLINRLPTKTLNMSTPFFPLHGTLPSYHDLHAFGCTCYPNLSATSPHKLAPPLHPLCIPWLLTRSQGLSVSRPQHQLCYHFPPCCLRRNNVSFLPPPVIPSFVGPCFSN
jgi:hypothetical protein